jgi:hypothetical protein
MSNMDHMKSCSCSRRLGDTLLSFRRQSCLDPRDKIYGLMGIAFSEEDLRLRADYSMTVKEVYKAATKYILNTYGSLDIICNDERYMCHCIHSKHLLSSLPSWVTDWTCLGAHKSQYETAQPSVCLILKPKFNLRIDGDVLACTGLVLGVINCTQRNDLPQRPGDRVYRVLGFLRNTLLFIVETYIGRVGDTTIESGLLLIPKLREIYRLFSPWSRHNPSLIFNNLSSVMSEEQFFSIYILLLKFCHSKKDFSIKLKVLLDNPKLRAWWQWHTGHLLHSLLFSMKIASTTSLGIGMCPNCCRNGDMVVLLYGCSWPVAIRAVEGGEEQFEILGPVQLGKDLEMDAISECEEREFSFV